MNKEEDEEINKENTTNTNKGTTAAGMIDAELTEIEHSLEAPRRNSLAASAANRHSAENGSVSTSTTTIRNNSTRRSSINRRAAFQSVASALRSIRDRLMAARASLTSSMNDRLSQRLEAAELAHSSRMPLEFVRQQQQQHNHNSTDDGTSTEADNANIRDLSIQEEDPSRAVRSIPSLLPRPAPLPPDRVHSEGSQRRPSLLVASRNITRTVPEDVFSLELHEAAQAAYSTITTSSVSDSNGSMNDGPENNKKRTSLDMVQEADHESSVASRSASFLEDEMEEDTLPISPPPMPIPVLLTKSQSLELERGSKVKNRRLTSALSGSFLLGISPSASVDSLEDGAQQLKPKTPPQLQHGVTSSTEQHQQELDEHQEEEPEVGPGSLIYSWGPTGLLSLHDDDETRTPKESLLSTAARLGKGGAPAVVSVAISTTHTACATISGSVLTCGLNQKGSVDPVRHSDNAENSDNNDKNKQQQRVLRPTLLESISMLNQRIHQVSCGYDHTAALSEHGSVLTWGSNEYGQLGHRRNSHNHINQQQQETSYCRPQGLVMTAGQRAASVACGHFFTLVLTTRMCVLAYGIDTIACGTNQASSTTPSTSSTSHSACHVVSSLPALQGLPLVAVAAGHHHAVVLTSSGTAYSWGVNDSGCCGRSYPQQLSTPVEMHVPPTTQKHRLYTDGTTTTTLSLKGTSNDDTSTSTRMTTTISLVASSSSSSKQSRFLQSPFPNWATWEENMMTRGQQKESQQHEETVMSLAGDVSIIHAACGESHTVLVTRSGGLLVCGSNYQGQLGLVVDDGGNDNNSGSSSSHNQIALLEPVLHPDYKSGGITFVTAEAGSSHTLLLDSEGSVWQMGGGTYTKGPECVLKGKDIGIIAAGGDHAIAIASGSSSTVRRYFSVPLDNNSSNTSSNRSSNAVVDTRAMADNLEELLNAISQGEHSQKGELATQEIANRTEELLQNPAVVNSLFFAPMELNQMYTKLLTAGDGKTQQVIASAIERGIGKGIDAIAPESARMMYPEAVRCLLIYIQFLDRSSDKGQVDFDVRGRLASRLMDAILGLPFEGYKAFLRWATSMYPGDLYIKMLVNPLLYQLEKSCQVSIDRDQVVHTSLSVGTIPLIVAVLQWLYSASEKLCIAKSEAFISNVFDQIPVGALYNDLHQLKMIKDKPKVVSSFNICRSPFLFSPSVKRNLLKMENQVEMAKAATADGVTVNLATGEFSLEDPFFKLEIDRHRMLEETLAIIKKAKPKELRKHLRVKFKGEEGVDAGGVTKEFFQLLSEELFDVSSGMWTDKFGENITWFNSNCVWDDEGYELTGVLVGLAMYNSVLLDVNFPMAVYRKLLGYPLGLEDMVDLELKRGFQQLLDYDGEDVEDVFCLNFEVTWVDDLGEERRRDLKAGGSEIPVTSENKEEYVRLYVTWLLVDSIYAQWQLFENGVIRVLEGSSITLCRPEELELLVVGSPELDFNALEANATYEGGYDKESETVKHFWSFVKGLDHQSQLNFLKFATGSSKAPIGGLGQLPFKVQRAGPDSPQLPTSHTCFNTLILPDYGSFDKVAERLGRAIVECEGFGLE